jgi:hypothetical protein
MPQPSPAQEAAPIVLAFLQPVDLEPRCAGLDASGWHAVSRIERGTDRFSMLSAGPRSARGDAIALAVVTTTLGLSPAVDGTGALSRGHSCAQLCGARCSRTGPPMSTGRTTWQTPKGLTRVNERYLPGRAPDAPSQCVEEIER